MLLASPDDDLDPVKPGTRYDEDIYHRFARPSDWKPPRQATLDRAVAVDDWCVVFEADVTANGKSIHLSGAEGRCTDVSADTITLMLTQGVGGGAGTSVQVPVAQVKVMALPVLTRGDRVRVRRGVRAGQIATVASFSQGMIRLAFATDATTPTVAPTVAPTDAPTILDYPIEALDKVHT
jgi:hypothetical protein